MPFPPPPGGKTGQTFFPTRDAGEISASNSIAITPPIGSADPAAYKVLFNITATAVDGQPGKFYMAIEGIKEEKVAEVSADAVATLLDSTDSTVAVPAGLYYKITSATSLPIVSASGTGTPSTGAAAAPPSKPGDDKGFFKVELRATPFAAE